MARFLSLVFLLALCAPVKAFAIGEFGPSGADWPDGDAARLRVGTSAGADAEALRFVVSIRWTGQRHLRAFYVRTGTQFVAGQWRIEVRDESGNLIPGADFVVTLQPESWNQIVLPQPAWVPSMPATAYRESVAATIRVVPVGSAEMEFRAWSRTPWPDAIYGEAYDVDTGRLDSQYTYLETLDGGWMPGKANLVYASVLVLESDDRTGPFTPSSCAADASTEASGNPYFEKIAVTDGDGGAIVQTFGHIYKDPLRDFLPPAFHVISPEFTPASGAFEVTDGTLVVRSGITSGANYQLTTPYFCFVVPAADAGNYALKLRATGAPQTAYALSAGSGLGLCDPEARATWGGSGFSLNGDPGRDLLFWGSGGPAFPFFRDDDGDSHGDPNRPTTFCPAAGYVENSDDCDDSNSLIHPYAAELCDGLDNDCDGLVDVADDDLVQVLCEKNLGVCRFSFHSKSQCADAGWQACTAAQYPASYSPTEPLVCDGIDNDCDGTSAAFVPCEMQQGVCAGAKRDLCADAGGCGSAEYGPDYESEEHRCDGLDNDCDGVVDEGCDAGSGSGADSGSSSDGGNSSSPPPACGCTSIEAAPMLALIALAMVTRARRSASVLPNWK